ncbi:HD-GYP domain-containing protein [bacterium]|nr:HD-GYP domain-containing protein [bacterium]
MSLSNYGSSGLNTLLSSSSVSSTILQNTIDSQNEEIKKEEKAEEAAEAKETAKAKETETEQKVAVQEQSQKLLETHEKISSRLESILRGDKGASESAGKDAEALLNQLENQSDDFSPETLQRLRAMSQNAQANIKQNKELAQQNRQMDFAEQAKRTAQQLREQMPTAERELSGRTQPNSPSSSQSGSAASADSKAANQQAKQSDAKQLAQDQQAKLDGLKQQPKGMQQGFNSAAGLQRPDGQYSSLIGSQQTKQEAAKPETAAQQAKQEAAKPETAAQQAKQQMAKPETAAQQAKQEAARPETAAQQAKQQMAKPETTAQQAAKQDAIAQQAKQQATKHDAIAQQAKQQATKHDAIAQQAKQQAIKQDAIIQQAKQQAAKPETVAQQAKQEILKPDAQQHHETSLAASAKTAVETHSLASAASKPAAMAQTAAKESVAPAGTAVSSSTAQSSGISGSAAPAAFSATEEAVPELRPEQLDSQTRNGIFADKDTKAPLTSKAVLDSVPKREGTDKASMQLRSEMSIRAESTDSAPRIMRNTAAQSMAGAAAPNKTAENVSKQADSRFSSQLQTASSAGAAKGQASAGTDAANMPLGGDRANSAGAAAKAEAAAGPQAASGSKAQAKPDEVIAINGEADNKEIYEMLAKAKKEINSGFEQTTARLNTSVLEAQKQASASSDASASAKVSTAEADSTAAALGMVSYEEDTSAAAALQLPRANGRPSVDTRGQQQIRLSDSQLNHTAASKDKTQLAQQVQRQTAEEIFTPTASRAATQVQSAQAAGFRLPQEEREARRPLGTLSASRTANAETNQISAAASRGARPAIVNGELSQSQMVTRIMGRKEDREPVREVHGFTTSSTEDKYSILRAKRGQHSASPQQESKLAKIAASASAKETSTTWSGDINLKAARQTAVSAQTAANAKGAAAASAGAKAMTAASLETADFGTASVQSASAQGALRQTSVNSPRMASASAQNQGVVIIQGTHSASSTHTPKQTRSSQQNPPVYSQKVIIPTAEYGSKTANSPAQSGGVLGSLLQSASSSLGSVLKVLKRGKGEPKAPDTQPAPTKNGQGKDGSISTSKLSSLSLPSLAGHSNPSLDEMVSNDLRAAASRLKLLSEASEKAFVQAMQRIAEQNTDITASEANEKEKASTDAKASDSAANTQAETASASQTETASAAQETADEESSSIAAKEAGGTAQRKAEMGSNIQQASILRHGSLLSTEPRSTLFSNIGAAAAVAYAPSLDIAISYLPYGNYSSGVLALADLQSRLAFGIPEGGRPVCSQIPAYSPILDLLYMSKNHQRLDSSSTTIKMVLSGSVGSLTQEEYTAQTSQEMLNANTQNAKESGLTGQNAKAESASYKLLEQAKSLSLRSENQAKQQSSSSSNQQRISSSIQHENLMGSMSKNTSASRQQNRIASYKGNYSTHSANSSQAVSGKNSRGDNGQQQNQQQNGQRGQERSLPSQNETARPENKANTAKQTQAQTAGRAQGGTAEQLLNGQKNSLKNENMRAVLSKLQGPDAQLNMQAISRYTELTPVRTLIKRLYGKDRLEELDEDEALNEALLLFRISDPAVYSNSANVLEYALGIAGELGLDDEQLKRELKGGAMLKDIGEMGIYLFQQDDDSIDNIAGFMRSKEMREASMLHDIGETQIPDSIKFKTTPLTEEEYEILKLHPIIGAEMIYPIPSLRYLCPTIRGHHERWDGKGYPDGLRMRDIPLAARILAIADTFEAIMSAQPYKNKIDAQVARQIINAGRGTHFDPQCVDAFERMIDSRFPRQAGQYTSLSIVPEVIPEPRAKSGPQFTAIATSIDAPNAFAPAASDMAPAARATAMPTSVDLPSADYISADIIDEVFADAEWD